MAHLRASPNSDTSSSSVEEGGIREEPVRIILVTGSVISGVGKGIISSSIASLLKAAGYRVSAIKIDPYLNIDAGTFSPFEHGEVFVLDDGSEVDLDLGNYERFIGIRLRGVNNITSGKIFNHVLERERRGEYLGKTVQIVPHVTGAIIDWVERVAKIPVDESNLTPEICVVELGGTVGDAEINVFTLAFNYASFNREPDANRFMSVHVTKFIEAGMGEIKTKPAQRGLADIQTAGLSPFLLMCRSKLPLNLDKNEDLLGKICAFSRLSPQYIIDVPDTSNLYKVPLMLNDKNVLEHIQQKLNLPRRKANIEDWRLLSAKWDELEQRSPMQTIKIAFVAKYVCKDDRIFTDAYASVLKALQHASIALDQKLDIRFINAELLENSNGEKGQVYMDALKDLSECHGIIVPGGFGLRGIEGKIEACKYAREHKVPFLGLCLGLQCAAIEFARNVCGIEGAGSTEFEKDDSRTITLIPEQQVIIEMPEHAGAVYGMGATLRRGRRTTVFLTNNSIMRSEYGTGSVDERHRHRYEVNPKLVPRLSKSGLLFVGMGVDELSSSKGSFKPNMRTQSALHLVSTVEKDLATTKDELLSKIEQLCSSKTNVRMEIAEMDIKEHPFFVGVQYHPEFLSHPTRPSPPFLGFIKASAVAFQGRMDNASN